MDRREFIRLVGGAAAIGPQAAWAQKAPAVIGFLGSQAAAPPPMDPQTVAFNQGFLDHGLIQGRDFTLEQRFTAGDDGRFPEFARDLAQLNVRMILANTPAGVRAVQHLDPHMPVVMVIMNDPVGAGLVASLARSGNHTTGTANLNEDVTPKLLEFLREIVPNARVLGVLFNPLNPTNPVMLENLRGKAVSFGVKVLPIAFKPRDDLDALFAELGAQRLDALQIIGDPGIGDLKHRITALASAHRLPLFSSSDLIVEAGGLVSYGASVNKSLRRTGYYVKRILDGANPADLPIEQPTGLELIINLKTAKKLGIEIPATLLARADRVIE
ncbi:MAG: ABC transporter substrate-binding protein [Bradyrhizobium sp.]|uniref:ABC transporter substrate-binding protein n=1 Tax=Bradyrhizobium sp. TaxID=376 RepID=UPI0027263AD0|nr:ABC transporter substrate-binding protein [Bradyrhizobium sp.]MDO8397964.1 ABC transporter substrate-binding protein [Bradyrhizobium sp.]